MELFSCKICRNAEALGVDRNNVSVGGSSAGGLIAAVRLIRGELFFFHLLATNFYRKNAIILLGRSICDVKFVDSD